MAQINIRVDGNTLEMLNNINPKPGTAAATAMDVFYHLRNATIAELRKRFTPGEIRGMAEAYKFLKPAWAIMSAPVAINLQLSNAENQKSAISINGAALTQLNEKISLLTSGQALILQLELISYWEHEEPDIKTLLKLLA